MTVGRISSSSYLDNAARIGDRLVSEAIPVSTGVTWEGDDLAGNKAIPTLVKVRLGPDLYSGTSGIGWFLGHLGAHCSEEKYSKHAIMALKFAISEAAAIDSYGLSLYAGATGVAMAAVEVGELLRETELHRSGSRLALKISSRLANDAKNLDPDLIGGIAGIVIGLLAVYRYTRERTILESCSWACKRLVESRQLESCGCSWSERSLNGKPGLCGLGHGASGIGWALAEVGSLTKDAKFLSIADEAFRYERSCFSRERCAWPDLREESGHTTVANSENSTAWTSAWCHGALGIGAVRLRLYELLSDVRYLGEASAAIQTARILAVQAGVALREGAVSDVTLCHGLGGAVELFLLAHEVLSLEEHRRAARRLGNLCLSIFRANGERWTSGLENAKYVPGLFLGLAGIGVTMMRLHDPALIGSPVLPGRNASSHVQRVLLQASRSA